MLHLNRKAEIQVLAMREQEQESRERWNGGQETARGDGQNCQRGGARVNANGVIQYVCDKLKSQSAVRQGL
jgi:hypothetical protein